MGLKGIAIGGMMGFFFGGPLGALFGAVLGNGVERKFSFSDKVSFSQRLGRVVGSGISSADGRRRDFIFCASAAAMLAKMAKADGRVSREEIASVEQAFRRLGFTPEAREIAIDVFRKAKDDAHTIYEYAGEFAASVSSVEIREIFYELLWDLACSDGVVGSAELEILRRIPVALSIRPQWFSLFASERLAGSQSWRESASRTERNALVEAYSILGVDASASDAAVRKAYHEKAKRYHPDTLRAQGLPDEMVSKATDMMAKVNTAWEAIKEARHL